MTVVLIRGGEKGAVLIFCGRKTGGGEEVYYCQGGKKLSGMYIEESSGNFARWGGIPKGAVGKERGEPHPQLFGEKRKTKEAPLSHGKGGQESKSIRRKDHFSPKKKWRFIGKGKAEKGEKGGKKKNISAPKKKERGIIQP